VRGRVRVREVEGKTAIYIIIWRQTNIYNDRGIEKRAYS
jgi:hypothetical protein